MRLRFTTSMASRAWVYHAGRVIEVDRLTPTLREWLARGILERVAVPAAAPGAILPAERPSSKAKRLAAAAP